MNPVSRRVVIALAVFALVATGAFALAQGTLQHRPGVPLMHGGQMMHSGQMMHGRGPGGPGGLMMLRHLNLTDEQRAQIHKLHEDARQSHEAERQKMFDLRKQLRDAIFADGAPNQAGIDAALQQIRPLEQQMEQFRLEMEKKVAGLLTDEQRKQVREARGPARGGRGF